MLPAGMQVAALFILLLCTAIGHAPSKAAQTPTHAGSSRMAIERIIEAIDLVNSEKVSQAQDVLRQIKGSLDVLVSQTQRFREIAIQQHHRCVERQGEFEKRVNDLYQQQQAEIAEIQKLEAALAEASKRRELTNAEIQRLTVEMSATAARLEENRAKLEELEKWWWVPGYGGYLGVRTLIDGDIQNHQRAARQLKEQAQQMEENQANINSIRILMTNIAAGTDQKERVIQELRAMEASDQAKLVHLKKIGVFLTNADVFWGKAANSLDVNGSSFIDTMQILHGKLAEEAGGISLSGSQSELNFRQSLVAFADSVDNNTNFLLRATTDYCGGPPNSNATAPTRCDIAAITQYYEIVDPATCAFRYLNPPGCPGNPRVAVVQEVTARASAAKWTTVEDQNWIGRARCRSTAAIYYGKLSSPAECQAKCAADRGCVVWTYNVNNGYMPDSIHECWGGTTGLSPNTNKWTGFQSGGISWGQ